VCFPKYSRYEPEVKKDLTKRQTYGRFKSQVE